MKTILAVVLVLAAITLLAACSSSPGTSTSPPPASSSTTTTATTSTASSTYGQFADAGKTVFAAKCVKCHGASGQGGTGPALIGSGASLGKYTNS